MVVPKKRSIMYSRDFIIFYANRRYKTVNHSSHIAPYQFNTLSTTISGFEAINETLIEFQDEITINNETFNLKSAVILEKSKTVNNLIVGCNAIIIGNNNDASYGLDKNTYFLYDPNNSNIQIPHDDGSFTNDPITYIPEYNTGYDDNSESAQSRLQNRGVIFIYVKSNAIANPIYFKWMNIIILFYFYFYII